MPSATRRTRRAAPDPPADLHDGDPLRELLRRAAEAQGDGTPEDEAARVWLLRLLEMCED